MHTIKTKLDSRLSDRTLDSAPLDSMALYKNTYHDFKYSYHCRLASTVLPLSSSRVAHPPTQRWCLVSETQSSVPTANAIIGDQSSRFRRSGYSLIHKRRGGTHRHETRLWVRPLWVESHPTHPPHTEVIHQAYASCNPKCRITAPSRIPNGWGTQPFHLLVQKSDLSVWFLGEHTTHPTRMWDYMRHIPSQCASAGLHHLLVQCWTQYPTNLPNILSDICEHLVHFYFSRVQC